MLVSPSRIVTSVFDDYFSLIGLATVLILRNTGVDQTRMELLSCWWVHRLSFDTLLNLHLQLNTLDEAATMTFNLTESPWINAGRQYSVRVSEMGNRVAWEIGLNLL